MKYFVGLLLSFCLGFYLSSYLNSVGITPESLKKSAINNLMQTSNKEAIEYKKKREELSKYRIIEVKGNPEYKRKDIWETIDENADQYISEDKTRFRTKEKESVIIQLQLENEIKLLERGEILVKKTVLEEGENKVKSEELDLINGEITVAVTLDGRDLLTINVPEQDIVIKGKTGLFKVIYNQKKQQGEVVIKNGLVEVTRGDDTSRKVSSFYKVTFDKNKLSKPTLASIIQYDWR